MIDRDAKVINTSAINRFALVLEPTEEYLKWARQCKTHDGIEMGMTLERIKSECTVYLVPEMEYEMEDWLEENYLPMFEHEVESWCMDEALWPEDMSFDAFKLFFRYWIYNMVIDMLDGPILLDKDEDEECEEEGIL